MKPARTYLVVVGAVSALAGLVIAGYPTSAHPLVLDRSTIEVALAATPGTDAAATIDPTSTTAATIAGTTTVASVGASTTTAPISSTTAPAAPTTAPPPPQPPRTTVVSPTTTSTTSTLPAPTSTAATTTTAPSAGLVDRIEVRLVVANGDGRFNLATANANRLRAAGYTQIDEADVASDDDPTVIFYRPGFEEEAARVGGDLGIPAATTTPLPEVPVTVNDELGDLIIVLGTDALR